MTLEDIVLMQCHKIVTKSQEFVQFDLKKSDYDYCRLLGHAFGHLVVKMRQRSYCQIKLSKLTRKKRMSVRNKEWLARGETAKN